MNPAHTLAVSIVLVAALAACGRETTTVVDNPAPSATTQAPAPATTTKQADLQSTSGNYSEALERLHKSAQGLRESIQTLSQRPAGPQRTVAIAMAHQALNATNQAMAQLPPDMRAEAVGATSAAGGSGSVGTIGSQPDSPQAMEALQKSSEALRQAVQAMADEPVGDRRNAAIKSAHQALADTNQAMIQMPERGSK